MSKGELAFTALENWCRSQGYPVPVPEYPLLKPLGRRHKADAAWVEHKVFLEIQGGNWMKRGGHTTGGAIEDDLEKFALAATLGWRVIPCTYKQFNSGQVYEWLTAIFAAKS